MRKFAWALIIAPALAAPGHMSTDAAARMVDGPKVHWNYSYWGKSRAATTYIEGLSGYLERASF